MHCSDLIDRLTAGADTPHRVFLAMGDCRFRVETNSLTLAGELTTYFAPFLCSPGAADIAVTALQGPVPDLGLNFQVKEPDPGKTKVKEEWADLPGGRVVRKRLTGLHFLDHAHHGLEGHHRPELPKAHLVAGVVAVEDDAGANRIKIGGGNAHDAGAVAEGPLRDCNAVVQ